MLANDLLIWSDVDAVNLVPGYETLDSLDFGPELAQHIAGRSRNVLQLLRGQSSGAWDLALNYVLWHWDLPVPGSRLAPRDQTAGSALDSRRRDYFTVTLNFIQGWMQH